MNCASAACCPLITIVSGGLAVLPAGAINVFVSVSVGVGVGVGVGLQPKHNPSVFDRLIRTDLTEQKRSAYQPAFVQRLCWTQARRTCGCSLHLSLPRQCWTQARRTYDCSHHQSRIHPTQIGTKLAFQAAAFADLPSRLAQPFNVRSTASTQRGHSILVLLAPVCKARIIERRFSVHVPLLTR